jgi:hypothetical protein
LLDRAVSLIDLRLADRTTVELAPPPAPGDGTDSSKTLVRAPAGERAI